MKKRLLLVAFSFAILGLAFPALAQYSCNAAGYWESNWFTYNESEVTTAGNFGRPWWGHPLPWFPYYAHGEGGTLTIPEPTGDLERWNTCAKEGLLLGFIHGGKEFDVTVTMSRSDLPGEEFTLTKEDCLVGCPQTGSTIQMRYLSDDGEEGYAVTSVFLLDRVIKEMDTKAGTAAAPCYQVKYAFHFSATCVWCAINGDDRPIYGIGRFAFFVDHAPAPGIGSIADIDGQPDKAWMVRAATWSPTVTRSVFEELVVNPEGIIQPQVIGEGATSVQADPYSDHRSYGYLPRDRSKFQVFRFRWVDALGRSSAASYYELPPKQP